jgi:hypothetical protein
MPGNVLHLGATVTCVHGGQAAPSAPSARVLVTGLAAATMGAPYAVAGCPFVNPAPSPCLTASWAVAATRVTSLGAPLLVSTGAAVCAPNGTPLIVTVVQPRVIAL